MALGHRDLPGGEGRGGKACRGQALVLFILDEWLVTESQEGEREGRDGIYEGEIQGDHLVVGRLACRREVGGDLNMMEDQELALFDYRMEFHKVRFR